MEPAEGRRTVAWRYDDGKPGHANQSRGLLTALGRLVEVEIHDLPAHGRLAGALDWALARAPGTSDLPDPDLIVGAGHATHLPMLAARRARGGRIVVLMRPSLPLGLFDLCVMPEHDGVPAGPGRLLTRGALNAVPPGTEKDPGRGIVLLGGPSAHYRWSDASVAAQVLAVTRRDAGIRWHVASSRRTPDGVLDRIAAEAPGNLTITRHQDVDRDWLPETLGRAGTAWVSRDSVSMVYEALTSGAATGLLDLEPDGDSRVARGVEKLVADGLVTPFARWEHGETLGRDPAGFDEAGRCARWIVDQWLSAR